MTTELDDFSEREKRAMRQAAESAAEMIEARAARHVSAALSLLAKHHLMAPKLSGIATVHLDRVRRGRVSYKREPDPGDVPTLRDTCWVAEAEDDGDYHIDLCDAEIAYLRDCGVEEEDLYNWSVVWHIQGHDLIPKLIPKGASCPQLGVRTFAEGK